MTDKEIKFKKFISYLQEFDPSLYIYGYNSNSGKNCGLDDPKITSIDVWKQKKTLFSCGISYDGFFIDLYSDSEIQFPDCDYLTLYLGREISFPKIKNVNVVEINIDRGVRYGGLIPHMNCDNIFNCNINDYIEICNYSDLSFESRNNLELYCNITGTKLEYY